MLCGKILKNLCSQVFSTGFTYFFKIKNGRNILLQSKVGGDLAQKTFIMGPQSTDSQAAEFKLDLWNKVHISWCQTDFRGQYMTWIYYVPVEDFR